MIMHPSLSFEKATVMASDKMPGQPKVSGDGRAVLISRGTVEGTKRIFKDPLEEGKVIMAFQDVFWGAKFGQVIDKFGIQWMLN